MPKRFTATEKWDDPWFRELSPPTKLLWQWLLDHCDIAGVIRPDFGLASFQIGQPVNEQNVVELGDRVKLLDSGKYLIVKFVEFQNTVLSPSSHFHRAVVKCLQSHGLPIPNPWPSLSQGFVKASPSPKVQVQVQVKEPEGVQGEIYSPESRVALHYLNEKSGRSFRECEGSLAPIHARLREKGVDISGVRKMIDRQVLLWKGDSTMEEYLRPQTLFGKQKFDSYYAAKDLPVNNGKKSESVLDQFRL